MITSTEKATGTKLALIEAASILFADKVTMVPDTTEVEIDLILLSTIITACFGLVETGKIAS